MICPNCGKETVGKFCPACGAKMPAIDETVVLNDANNPWKQAAEAAKAQEQPAPSQGFAAKQPAPNQGFMPNQPAPNQGYMPNQPAPNQGYAPNQAAPNQGYAPNQAAPNQGYAGYPGRNYVPEQGGSASQAPGSYQNPSPAAIGQTPASQLVRKLATSGPWIIAVLATTLSFLVCVGYLVYNLIVYKQVVTKDYIISAAPGLLIAGIFVLLLWSIVGSASSKSKEKMGSGALTTMKVFFIISLIFLCIALALTVIFGVIILVVGSKTGIDQYTDALKQALLQFNVNLTGLDAEISGFIGVIFGIMAAILLFAIIFVAKVIKSLNTGKRVIRTGVPDDRVSPFVGVFTIIGAVFMIIIGLLLLLLQGVMASILAGMNVEMDSLGFIAMAITFLLNGVASFFFAIVLFKFRSGMRQLGVRKGVMQRPVQ